MEDAAILARAHGIGALPVVDNGKLAGIITATDVMNIFIEVLGLEKATSRLHVHKSFIGKPLGEITGIINGHGVQIVSMFTVTVPRTREKDLIVRLKTKDPSAIVEDLRSHGYDVDVTR
jgi:acetoin utilization protein AcuB